MATRAPLKADADLAYLRASVRPSAVSGGDAISVVDLFSGCGGLTLGALEGARRAGRPARLALAVDVWEPALEVLELTLEAADRVVQADLAKILGGLAEPIRESEQVLVDAGRGATLLLAGPPCQGHSALNNHTRHDDPRNDLYLAVARVARLLEPRAVIVENVRGVGRDRRRAVARCTAALQELDYAVVSRTLELHTLGAPQRRIRHVLVATRDWQADLDVLPERPGRSVGWAIQDLIRVNGQTLFDTASVPSQENEKRINWLFEHDEVNLPNDLRPVCHRTEHSYLSMYGRLSWEEPAQTITSGFGSMGQGRFVHPRSARTLTPHEAARLQFLPDFVDFSLVEQRTQLAAMIGNAAPPILTMVLIEALVEQGLL